MLSERKDVYRPQFVIPEGRKYAVVDMETFRDTELSIEAKAIYADLCGYANIIGFCSPSIETLCRDTNISRNRFYNHINQLKDKGLITTKRVKNTTTGEFYNLYRVLDPIYTHNYNLDIENFKKCKENDFNYNNEPDLEVDALFSVPQNFKST